MPIPGMVDTAMVDTVARDLLMLIPKLTMAMVDTAVDMAVMEGMPVAMEVMAVTDMVDVTTVRYLTTPKQP